MEGGGDEKLYDLNNIYIKDAAYVSANFLIEIPHPIIIIYYCIFKLQFFPDLSTKWKFAKKSMFLIISKSNQK